MCKFFSLCQIFLSLYNWREKPSWKMLLNTSWSLREISDWLKDGSFARMWLIRKTTTDTQDCLMNWTKVRSLPYSTYFKESHYTLFPLQSKIGTLWCRWGLMLRRLKTQWSMTRQKKFLLISKQRLLKRSKDLKKRLIVLLSSAR